MTAPSPRSALVCMVPLLDDAVGSGAPLVRLASYSTLDTKYRSVYGAGASDGKKHVKVCLGPPRNGVERTR